MSTFFERYVWGEYEAVWDDMQALGDKIYDDAYSQDVDQVVTETMCRVRKNFSILYAGLNRIGYQFGIYPDGTTKIYGYTTPITPPLPDILGRIAKYEQMEGIQSFPLSIKKFWEVVGDVDFCGRHSDLPRFADPIVVYPIQVINYCYTEWLEYHDENSGEEGGFAFAISPDFYHKDNISGGEPYQLAVPNHSVDGVVLNLGTDLTFVSYLRVCFDHIGFFGACRNSKVLAESFTIVGKDFLKF
jgi:hypothetical protein